MYPKSLNVLGKNSLTKIEFKVTGFDGKYKYMYGRYHMF